MYIHVHKQDAALIWLVVTQICSLQVPMRMDLGSEGRCNSLPLSGERVCRQYVPLSVLSNVYAYRYICSEGGFRCTVTYGGYWWYSSCIKVPLIISIRRWRVSSSVKTHVSLLILEESLFVAGDILIWQLENLSIFIPKSTSSLSPCVGTGLAGQEYEHSPLINRVFFFFPQFALLLFTDAVSDNH